MPKYPLLGMTLTELQSVTKDLGMPAFAAKQIASWLYDKKVTSIDEMTNALDPVELAAIINKKHHAIINGKKFKTSRAISCRSFNRYFSVSTDYRPKLEALLACSQMLGINQVVAHNGNGGRERIGETGTVLGLNARDSKHAGRMFSMHNCQINPGAGPEITTPWKSYQHEKNKNGLMPLIRRRTLLQL